MKKAPFSSDDFEDQKTSPFHSPSFSSPPSHEEEENPHPIWIVHGGMTILYLLCAGYFIYAIFRYASAEENGAYSSLFWLIHSPVHEIGHFLFSSATFPLLIHVLAGTVFQILTPIACAAQFFYRGEYPPLAIMLGWLGFAILDVSCYMEDSRILKMQLASPFAPSGSEIIHDWNWLFDYFGCLHHAYQIADCTAFLGYVISGFSVLLILFMVLRGGLLLPLQRWIRKD